MGGKSPEPACTTLWAKATARFFRNSVAVVGLGVETEMLGDVEGEAG
jgi:hypothetical protein